MTWREVCEADLIECLNLEPRHVGHEIVGWDRAVEIWHQLIRTRSFNSSVIEYLTPEGRRKIAHFGASVFVSPQFVTQELEDPKPYLNSRLIAGIAAGDRAILPESGLCKLKTPEPLDIIILAGDSPSRTTLAPDQEVRAENLMVTSFKELLVGYRLNRIIKETVDKAQHTIFESSGVWQTVSTFPHCERALVTLTGKTAFAVSGSAAGALFLYQEPVLRLRDTEKHLLSEAMHGETDTELASKLNLSLSTVKKRWNSLFARIAENHPELLPEADNKGDESRGPQKRHHILAYVRTHPQELRPYRWYSFK